MSNRLQYETSPYLLQHAKNPVDWYPWGDEAFEKSKKEDKPIFLSIGYSTCHWCHVMAHESFENDQIAHILNKHYICIKVDREERPDIDHVYMTACQAMTGSGGWPASLFLTPDKKPFFAGTYFPPNTRQGMMGFSDLICSIAEQWQSNRDEICRSANKITAYLKERENTEPGDDENLPEKAVMLFQSMYDSENGGFGAAPKFPTPHNLIFLMLYGKLTGEDDAIKMALHTLTQMQRGGIYDHIGGGFSRYSTDRHFLVPHFEKMLYDNALLIIAYAVAYSVSGKDIFLRTAKECAQYVLREMTDGSGGFYSAQDADSLGGEGMYYVFEYNELLSVLGDEKGKAFCEYFGVTEQGNFEGKNILNRLSVVMEDADFHNEIQILYKYRKERMKLHLDDKILTARNALMISAFVYLYRASGEGKYLDAAVKANVFIEKDLCENDRLYVGTRNRRRAVKGFLDDYAFYCASLISLYSATGEPYYLDRAKTLCKVSIELFWDEHGGFLMSGKENEEMILSAKETYDGAIPSGNAVMLYVLTRILQFDHDDYLEQIRQKQEAFLRNEASEYPAGHSMFVLSLLFSENPPPKIVAVCTEDESRDSVVKRTPLYADLSVLLGETNEYKLLNGKTTYYVCRDRTCLPPTNIIEI